MAHTLETIFGLLGAMALLVAVARRVQIPYPIFLVIGGLLVSLFPALPQVELAPEIVFLLFLPPIITSAAYFTPVRDFRRNLRSILLLAIGLVLFTTTIVAVTARMVAPEMGWAAAFALGAIVAPPDAIAATSVAKRLNLPHRIVTILEGESLVNDASALVIYQVAVAAAISGVFSFGDASLRFVLMAGGGLLVGLVLGWLVSFILNQLDDTPVEIILTFLGSFVAYLVAEELHFSGVLATVALGLYVGRQSTRVMSPATRIQGEAVWEIVIFVINGMAFILIGLQLPQILSALADDSWLTLAGQAAAVCLAVIAARMIWMPFGAYIPRLIPAINKVDPFPPFRNVVVISWAGMRGIVSLAAALALPTDFPQRDLILFLTFCVILVTLVGQGLTMPFVIRRLGLVDEESIEREEHKARLVAAKAGMARLAELEAEEWVITDHIQYLRGKYEQRSQRYLGQYHGNGNETTELQAAALLRLQRELIQAEFAALIQLRNSGVINDEIMRRVQRELDLEQLRLG
jgi:CPA1 family monovalent cation:H+ antiporter